MRTPISRCATCSACRMRRCAGRSRARRPRPAASRSSKSRTPAASRSCVISRTSVSATCGCDRSRRRCDARATEAARRDCRHAGRAPAPRRARSKHAIVVVRDPAGHFVEIIEPEELPETAAPPTANVVAVRVLLTVADVAQSLQLYGDALGMKVLNGRTYAGRASRVVCIVRGRRRACRDRARVQIPTSGI